MQEISIGIKKINFKLQNCMLLALILYDVVSANRTFFYYYNGYK
jgi:hypothetical protein